MEKYPNLNKKLKLMEERNTKPRKKRKINLEIDTDAIDITVKRDEGGKAEIKIDTEFVDFSKTAEGTKLTVEKGGLLKALFKLIKLKK
jgi:hypothetical protein